MRLQSSSKIVEKFENPDGSYTKLEFEPTETNINLIIASDSDFEDVTNTIEMEANDFLFFAKQVYRSSNSGKLEGTGQRRRRTQVERDGGITVEQLADYRKSGLTPAEFLKQN